MPSDPATAPTSQHRWRFFRAGGFDQAQLDSGEDLLHLDQLDQKLWVALSCPTTGLHFDPRTLELVDSDADGHVRAPELIAAAKWAGALLKSSATLAEGGDGLALAAIRDDTEDGRRVAASARQILANLGKADAGVITTEDTASRERIFAKTRFNGDGVVTAGSTDDEALKKAIEEIVACLGGEPDRSGEPGISEDKLNAFFEQAQKWSDWQSRPGSDAALMPLGEATPAAAAALQAVCAKIDDYFTRCRLAAYDAHSAPALNGSEADYLPLAKRSLAAPGEEVAALPLAVAAPGKPLPLGEGINPAWDGPMAVFRDQVVKPLLGDRDSLAAAEWKDVCARLDAHRAWAAEAVDTPVAQLGLPRVREVLASRAKEALAGLIAQDKALEAEANAIAEVDRLVRYKRDLLLLTNNFVSFRDFYTRRGKATFQAGTLYLDGRSFDLCVRVDDPNKHAVLANLSRVYLVYCTCVRGAEKKTIAAAISGGDSDQLMVGRNGVFYDRSGKDWNATIVKILDHPISIRQAFWGPWKKIGKMVGEQIQKLAASRAKAAEDKAATEIAKGAASADAGKAPAQPFDVGKFAGIFAAIGLAVGAIGTAAAALVTGMLGLKWWQMPLAIAGLMLIVSGPAMVIAWFKLRQRNLGPILDAIGWAVNARARINIPFGTSLTQLAVLPEGAERSLSDPYAEKGTPWGVYVAIGAAIAIVLWLLLFRTAG